jgi:hypothetical protein
MRSRSDRSASGYRRTALAAAASGALLFGGLGPASSQPGRPAAAPFSNGTANATAIVARVAPGVGSLELAIANGVAVSEITNHLAQAQAQTLDLGLIGTTLGAEGCDGGDPTVSPDQLPQPTRVDNRAGDTEATSDEVPVAGSTLGVGRELARATTAPGAVAAATSAASFGPVVNVSGGRAEAVTEVVDGAARQAHASVEAAIDIAGIVQLGGLRWDALHRTGSDPRAEGTFDIGTARVLGVPVPLESLATLETVLNQALAPSGITISFPKVERFEQPTDLVRVTPLRIVLKDSPVGKTAFGPALDLTREQRGQLFDQLAAAYCRTADFLLVGDIGLSVVSGTGFLAVEIGGAEARSADLVLENPFGSAIAPTSAAGPGPGLPSTGAAGAVPALALTPPASAAPAAPATTPVASIGPLEAVCETIHPQGAPGCTRGALVPLGLLGLAATAAVAGLDWRHQRRRVAAAPGVTVAAGPAS